jgi:hypothetical protein
VFNEKIDEQRGLAHSGHPFDRNMLGRIYEKFVTGDAVFTDRYIHEVNKRDGMFNVDHISLKDS